MNNSFFNPTIDTSNLWLCPFIMVSELTTNWAYIIIFFHAGNIILDLYFVKQYIGLIINTNRKR